MTQLRTGARLRSQVDATEVVVVRAPKAPVEITIGGAPAIDIAADPASGLALDPALSEGTLLGKRYTREAGDLEVLISKPGEGTLAADGWPLTLKGAKPLPSSD